jgi:hypothetical protein
VKRIEWDCNQLGRAHIDVEPSEVEVEVELLVNLGFDPVVKDI